MELLKAVKCGERNIKIIQIDMKSDINEKSLDS